MRISDRLEFGADPATTYQMLTDRSFLEQVCLASHAQTCDVVVEGDRTQTTRSMPAPDAAARFTGPTLTVVEQVQWGAPATDQSRTGEITMTVPGQPVKLSGTLTLRPEGTASALELDAELKVSIPLLGKKMEEAAAPAVLSSFHQQRQVSLSYLSS